MKGAWVTLATNDSYSLGALVLAHSLKQVGTTKELAILVTPGVTNSMRTRLSEVFNLVKEVNVLDSRDQSNLRLLQRPELGITFTKLHCWRLTQYEKCVFLDADTLVLQNCDELFDREEFSAAPDVGWPDCFNSGVFVYKPSGETYDKLIQFALEKGSFDGGDQGLLNLYFSDWAHKDISKHLPFIYNVCSTAFYSYLPAFKQFGKDVKILHFIGNAKPWLQYFDTETRKVRPSGDVGHLTNVLQRWWDIFCHIVHPSLSPDMSASYPEIASESTPTQSLQISYTKPDSPIVHLCETQNVWDPWEEYDKKQQNSSSLNTEPFESHNTRAFSFSANEPSTTFHSAPSTPIFHEIHDTQRHQSSNLDNSNQFDDLNVNNSEAYSEPTNNEQSSHECSHQDDLFCNVNHEENSVPVVTTGFSNEFPQTPPSSGQPGENCEISATSAGYDYVVPSSSREFHNQASSHPVPIYPVDPPCPPETHTVSPPAKTLEECETEASINNGDTGSQNEMQESGLAGAFAKLILGQHRTPEQEALESSLRRQNWEQGNIDYLGKDSFDNIWSKICETLSKGPTEEAAGEPQVVSLATTAIPNVAAEQQAPKERPSSQDIATAAETPKGEQQASETKESSVTPLPVEEIDTTKREEAVCVLPISKKDNEVPLELTPSSGTPSQLPTETPVVFATAPAIPTEIVPPPLLSSSTKSDDVQVTKEKELPPSTFLHTEKKADIDSTATSIETPGVVSSPTNILQENISLQSQLPVKTNETLPMMPQAPTKLEEAIQVISVSEKTSENLVDSCVVQQKESAKSESAPNVNVASMPQSLNNAQTPALVEKVISAQTSPAPVSQCSDAQDSHLVQTLPSHVQTPTTQILTPISQTPSQEQSSDLSPITPAEDISPTKQTSSVEQTSFPQQTTPQAPISSAIEASLPKQSPVEVIAPSALCAEIPIGAVSPQITSPEKTSAPSTKPADTPLHVESASVKETATKDSQTSQPHDSAASSHVASETKQAISSPSANVEAACPIAPPPRKSGGSKKQGKSKK